MVSTQNTHIQLFVETKIAERICKPHRMSVQSVNEVEEQEKIHRSQNSCTIWWRVTVRGPHHPFWMKSKSANRYAKRRIFSADPPRSHQSVFQFITCRVFRWHEKCSRWNVIHHLVNIGHDCLCRSVQLPRSSHFAHSQSHNRMLIYTNLFLHFCSHHIDGVATV